MPTKQTLTARRRSRYTGESHQHAMNALAKLGRDDAPIPTAIEHQAAIESLFLQALAQVHLSGWEPKILPFGVAWVNPQPDNIEIGIPTRFLSDVVAQLIPTVYTPDLAPCGHGAEVYGIPGLRAEHRNGRTILFRIGSPGQIHLPVSAQVWQNAVQVVRSVWTRNKVAVLWDSHPHDWHPLETEFTDLWPNKYQVGGEHFYGSRLASDLLRRLPGVCQPASCHDMWFNFHGRSDAEYHIQLEWALGQPPRNVLDLLLDPEFGMNIEIKLVRDQTQLKDCYTDDCSYVRLVNRDGSGSRIDLRRLMYPGADLPDLTTHSTQ